MDTYQDELRAGGVVRGERECDERWALIEPHVPAAGVLLDVGSNLGYFGLRAALARTGLAVVSLEGDPAIAARQASIVAEHADLHRMMVLLGHVDAQGAAAWAETCDWFDTTLLLSVIHWFDDPAAVVAALSSMSGTLVCEVPDPADTGACGQEKLESWSDPVQWFASVTGRRVHHLGRVSRHTSDVPSHIVLVDGPVERTPSRPYRGGPAHLDDRYHVRHDGRRTTLTVGGVAVERRHGVNLVNLMRAGALLHPAVGTLFDDATAELDRHPAHPDPFPHNMLWGPDGVRLIDFTPVDALLTTNDARETLRVHLPRWRDGATVADEAAVRSHTWVNLLRGSAAGQALLRLVPKPIKRATRKLLFGR